MDLTAPDKAADGQFVFLVGAHKAGTTSIAQWLGQHPGVSVAKSKEPNVFNHRAVVDRSDPYWREFRPGRLYLDASTNYSKRSTFPGTAARIRAFAPEAKIIYLTRDPLARLWSAWRQHLDESGYPIAADFATAVQTDGSLVDATLYRAQLAAYQDLFPEDQIFTTPLELLTAEPDEQRRLLSFLQLQPTGGPLPKLNSGDAKKQDIPGVRHALESTVGQAMADRLRESPLRRPLAAARRRFVMRPVRPDVACSRSWDIIEAAEQIRSDCLSYLDHLGIDQRIWPSLDHSNTGQVSH